MQFFHEEHILSTYNTKRAKKRREHLAKTQEILEGYELNRIAEEALEEKEQKALRESFDVSLTNYHKENRNNIKSANKKVNSLNEKIDEVCKDLFFYFVYESLLIDNNIKEKNFNYIREESNKFFETCANNNAIIIKEGSGFGDLIDRATEFIKEDINNENGIDVKKIIQKTLISEDMIGYYGIESIKLKTAECLRNEKKGSIIKEELESEGKYVDPNKSLFRKIFEKNIQETIEKCSETNPDSLQDISMVETILDYTILEAANTLQLVKFKNLKNFK